MSDPAPEAADADATPIGDDTAVTPGDAAVETAEGVADGAAETADGAADTAEGVAEEEKEDEGPKELTEIEILQRLGEIELESHKEESGIKGFFCNSNNFEKYGLITQKEQDDSVPFSGNVTFPYKILDKQAMLDEVKKVGFVSDFHPVQKEVEKYPLSELLIIRDHERAFGENFVWVNTQESFELWMERISEMRQKVIDEYNQSLLAPGGAEGEGEEGAAAVGGFIGKEVDIVAKDLPITPRPWESETQQATAEEVAAFTVVELRPAVKVQIQRKRMHFGQPVKFNDAQENVHLCRPQKDPNFALHRRELELGIQAVKSYSTIGTQTTWYKPQNAIIQYSTADFIKERTRKERYSDADEIAALQKFIRNVARSTEEALQQNETIDIFKDEFSNLGEEDFGYGSKSQANLKEHRNWHDVTYTKGKRIEAVEWVPGSTTMLACSCCDSSAFSERYESSGKAETSFLLFWSFLDSISPQTVLVSPWDATVFKFYPSDPTYMVAGLANGQLAIWRLSQSDLTGDSRERKANGSGGQVPQVAPKLLSVIDDGHKKAVSFIYWLPSCLEIERKGKTSLKQKWDENDPVRFFITISGDGQLLIWDFITARDSITDPDFLWKPVHRVQLQRQDSGTEMGLCQLLYRLPQLQTGSEEDEGTRKKSAAVVYTNFYASTEEGEVMFGDWAAKADDDRKPEFCKKILTISKSFRPMYCLQRSPFFPDLILGVVDWGFYLWKEGEKEHIFSSPAAQSYFTCASWSPTRPSVIFFGRLDGSIDVWDFSDQSHKPSVSHPAASVALSTLVFVPDAAAKDLHAASQLAVGDEQGHLHLLFLPKNLVKAAREEMSLMQRFIDREVVRINYFLERKEHLAQKKQVEQVVEEEEEGLEKEEKMLQEQYEAFEKWCVENLK